MSDRSAFGRPLAQHGMVELMIAVAVVGILAALPAPLPAQRVRQIGRGMDRACQARLVLLPMARMLGYLGLAGSVYGLVLVHTVYGLAFTTLFFRSFFVGVSDGIVQAAKIDGAGFFGIFFRILLPMAPPTIVVTVIWQFTQIWNDFLFGIAFTVGDSNPVTVALNNIVATSTGIKEYNVDMAAAIIAALPTLFIYVLAGKYFVRGLAAGAVKG